MIAPGLLRLTRFLVLLIALFRNRCAAFAPTKTRCRNRINPLPIPRRRQQQKATHNLVLSGLNDGTPSVSSLTDEHLPKEHNDSSLGRLGWQPYFANQLEKGNNTESEDGLIPVRISEVHSQGICIVGAGPDGGIKHELIPNIPPKLQEDSTSSVVPLVGDWILVNDRRQIMKVLDRHSLLQRRAPGRGLGGKIQLMAANVDTVFVVSSCNQDFNVARLERYVAMVLEASNQQREKQGSNADNYGVTPVIVLTKRDQWDGVDEEESLLPYYTAQAEEIVRKIPVVLLDARGTEPAEKLREWLRPGQTVAFLGSSGVGKSTLVNSLCGDIVAKTGDIHQDSGQGRHTTTRRQLHFLPDNGCAVMDTPGLRELQLIQASNGVAEVFADLVELSSHCGFRNCRHSGEPDCAIEAAIFNEDIDEERVERWKKLVLEDQHNMKTMMDHERRRKGRGDSLSNKKPEKTAIRKKLQKKNKTYRKRLER